MAKKKSVYFDQFSELARLTVKEAELLQEAIETWSPDCDWHVILERAHEVEHAGDVINHEVYHNVATDFVTPIEREDIIAVAAGLDDVIDSIENVMQLFYMYDVHSMSEDASKFADIILKSCKAVEASMGDFSEFKKSKNLRELLIAINDCEEEGDQVYMDAIRTLHTTYRDEPMRVLVWSRIFDRMEKCCDGCEHVADAMDMVLLKNS